MKTDAQGINEVRKRKFSLWRRLPSSDPGEVPCPAIMVSYVAKEHVILGKI